MALKITKRLDVVVPDLSVTFTLTESTYDRLVARRVGFESFDATVTAVLDRLDQFEAGGMVQVLDTGPTGLAAALKLIPEPVVPKVGNQLDLMAAIEQALDAVEGPMPKMAAIKEVLGAVELLMPEAAAHPNFKQHVSWAASALRKAGRLQNGRDHGQWGLWRLVERKDA